MTTRRTIEYADWDAVLADLRHLSQGYTRAGNWDLEQSARHLNEWLRFPMDGYPKPPLIIALGMALIRTTVGPFALRKVLADGKMKDGLPTSPDTTFVASTDPEAEHAAVDALCATIDRFRGHQGPIHPSPIFGRMDKTAADKLQRIHCAHHLSWLIPHT